MPKYTINGKTYTSATPLSDADLEELAGNTSVKPTTPSFMDRFKGTPDWMVSKPGQGWDDANASASGGDVTNPMAYLAETQKTAQGPAMQAVSQGVRRGLQVGAGIAKGAVLNPVSAVGEFLPGGDAYSAAVKRAYDTQRENAGAEGFDWAELAGAVVSPVNKFIPTGPAGSIASRGALGGAISGVLNPLEQENLTPSEFFSKKIEQMGLGAVVGRVGVKLGDALVPTLKPGVKELMDQGVPVSPGMAYEGMPGWVFRQMESMGLGPSTKKINTAFNTVVANDVLSSIDKTVPDTVKPGQHAVEYVKKTINDAYDDAFANIGKNKFDLEYKEGINKAISDATKNIANTAEKSLVEKRLLGSLNSEIGGRLKQGEIDGNGLKNIQVWLKKQIEQNTGTGVVKEGLKQGYEDVLANLNKFIDRVDTAGGIRKADTAWAKLYDFAQASKASSKTGGIFSPEQLAQASTVQAENVLQAGAGTRPLQGLAQQGIDVLGEQTPLNLLKATMLGSKALTGAATYALAPQIAIPILVSSGIAYPAAKLLMKNPSAARLAVQRALQDNPGLLGNAAVNVFNQLQEEQPSQPTTPPVVEQTPQQQTNIKENIKPISFSNRDFNPNHPVANKVRAAADKYGIGQYSDLLVKQAYQESQFNPKAVSKAGAKGIMQLMPGTARDLGVKDVYNEDANIDAGVRYMSQLLKKYNGNTAKALAAYNWGAGNVDKKGTSKMPKETRDYLKKILGKTTTA